MAQRILFATMPFDGHFKPLTGIAMHLRRTGHDVRWYAGPTLRQRSSADLGIPHLPFKRAREVNGENIADLFPERARLSRDRSSSRSISRQVFVANCRSALPRHPGDPRDVPLRRAVRATRASSPRKLIAEKLGLPVLLGRGRAAGRSLPRDVPPPFFGFKPARTPLGRLVHRVVRRDGSTAR